jgi:hypothetical protein
MNTKIISALILATLTASCADKKFDPAVEYPCGMVVGEEERPWGAYMDVRDEDGSTHSLLISQYDAKKWSVGDKLPCE